MEVILTNKGKKKVLLDGYEYCMKVTRNDWIRWQCRYQRTGCCKGAITTNLDALSNSTTSVLESIGSLETIRRDLRQQRSKVRPPEPQTTADIQLRDTWTMTGGPEKQPFLIYDNGPERRDRMLVFASHEQLRALSTSRTWYMDGTFSVCPRLFKQLYVIRCTAGESTVACVYALLPGKTFSIYEELFQAILDTCEAKGYAPYPEIIISDYEMAAIRASKAVFGEDVTTKGCFFHLCQSTHRKVRELGLISRYKTDDRFKKMCGMLDGLAFLPPDLVPVGLDYIRGQAPTDLDDLIDYFDATSEPPRDCTSAHSDLPVSDATYSPSRHEGFKSDERGASERSPEEQRKFLVFDSSSKELFKACRECSRPCQTEITLRADLRKTTCRLTAAHRLLRLVRQDQFLKTSKHNVCCDNDRGSERSASFAVSSDLFVKRRVPCLGGPSPHSLSGGPLPVSLLGCGSLLTGEEVSPLVFPLSGRDLSSDRERDRTCIGDFSNASPILALRNPMSGSRLQGWMSRMSRGDHSPFKRLCTLAFGNHSLWLQRSAGTLLSNDQKRDSGVKLLGKAKAAHQDVSDLLQGNLGTVHSNEEFSHVKYRHYMIEILLILIRRQSPGNPKLKIDLWMAVQILKGAWIKIRRRP
ncbi:hypothetical protein HPB47_003803 [Ixodes persulcatus]|uniref:Uncharacterized protein n=1 Tax=Ixodes persulcatus TaxID=34615 RepID=A0AC60PHG0_IXOPE|nr:hypothetical protein HPB47_003803 [Ixodes persulcatus]